MSKKSEDPKSFLDMINMSVISAINTLFPSVKKSEVIQKDVDIKEEKVKPETKKTAKTPHYEASANQYTPKFSTHNEIPFSEEILKINMGENFNDAIELPEIETKVEPASNPNKKPEKP